MELPFKPLILADSISWVGNRLMTVLVPIPTVKLAEVRTHRLLSQLEGEEILTSTNDKLLSLNANSSRAIPMEHQIRQSRECSFMPIWTEKGKGMQGQHVSEKEIIDAASGAWAAAQDLATYYANILSEDWAIHKQDSSLLLNPFTWTTCIITADSFGWSQWFELRCPDYRINDQRFYSKRECMDYLGTEDIDFEKINVSMTYPAIQVIAEAIYDLWNYNTPKLLYDREWHIPFIDQKKLPILSENPIQDALDISVSKCALISYNNQEKNETIEEHKKRAERLKKSGHYSTMEHQYQVPTTTELFSKDFKEEYRQPMFGNGFEYHRGIYVSNVKGWKQYRKIIEEQNKQSNETRN